MSDSVQQIPKGYKNTEAGVIPEDWEATPFQEIVSKFIDYRGVTPKKLGMEWGNGNICALSANNVQMGYIDFGKECYLASEKLYKRWMRAGDCEQDDILLTMEAPLGNVAFIPDKKKYILSQRTILIKPKDIIEKVFLRHMMTGRYFQNSLIENSTGTTAQGIQRKKLEKINFYYPRSKTEQMLIACILTDTENLIVKLEKLIAKKKAIKQGVMQELLTGKKRLPGFNSDWEEKSLEECGNITMGQSPPGNSYSSNSMGLPLLNGAVDLKEDGIFVTQYTTKPTRTSKKGDLLFCIRATIGNLQVSDKKYCLGRGVAALTVYESNDKEFIAYKLQELFELMRLHSEGGVIKGLRKDELKEMKISIPSKLDEQMAISIVLSDMDKDLRNLENELDKYQHIKVGMMQQLLTGKIRIYESN